MNIWVRTVPAMNTPVTEPARLSEPPELITASGTTGSISDQEAKAAATAISVVFSAGLLHMLSSFSSSSRDSSRADVFTYLTHLSQ